MVTLFINHFSDSASFKSVYFNELAKRRSADPLFEVRKREGHVFVQDNSFNKEVRAAVRYRTAKAKGIVLVNQNW